MTTLVKSNNFVVRAFYQLNDLIKLGYHYRFTHSKVDITTGDANKPLKKSAKVKGDISAYGTSFIYDSTNNPVRPTAGFKSIARWSL